MIANWLSGLVRKKKEIIRPLEVPVAVQESAPQSLHHRLVQELQEIDVNALMQNPLTAVSIMTLYCPSIDELMKEAITPSRMRSLVGVSLQYFFKESHLTPQLALERLSTLFKEEPKSNFARFDIQILISELQSFSKE